MSTAPTDFYTLSLHDALPILAFEIFRVRVNVFNEPGVVHQRQGLVRATELEFRNPRELRRDVPASPALDYRQTAQTLFTLLKFFQNLQGRDGRRETVLARLQA